jgi:hypothetical protein
MLTHNMHWQITSDTLTSAQDRDNILTYCSRSCALDVPIGGRLMQHMCSICVHLILEHNQHVQKMEHLRSGLAGLHKIEQTAACYAHLFQGKRTYTHMRTHVKMFDARIWHLLKVMYCHDGKTDVQMT